MNRIIRQTIYAALLCLLLVAIFDPADRLTHLKVPLFVAICSLSLISVAANTDQARVPLRLLLYVFAFSLLIPLTSICIYMLRGGSLLQFDGFLYLRAYMFLLIALVLSIHRFELVRPLSFLLTIQSVLTVAVDLFALNNPVFMEAIHQLGETYGMVTVSVRTYGDVTFKSVYYSTSPLLVIPIAYFTFKFLMARGRTRLVYMVLLAFNLAGMWMSGTRNNMIASCLAFLSTWFLYSKRRYLIAGVAATGIAALACANWTTIAAMLSSSETSNAIKLQHLQDYLVLLSDPWILAAGQGLGAFFRSTSYGNISISELTYFDLLRCYGLVLAAPVLALLFYPLTRLWTPEQRGDRFLFVGYALYLYLCSANPFLFSSSGMLVLAIVACKTFRRAHCNRDLKNVCTV